MSNTLKKFKNIKTIDGTNIKLELIEDISKYRGFYFIFPNGDKTKANYNSSCLEEDIEQKYARGYKIKTSNLIEHLYNKIKNKQELSDYEKKDFYELINLREPVVYFNSIKYDFREILIKVKNVRFWTVSEKPNKEEKTIYESGNVYADWTLE